MPDLRLHIKSALATCAKGNLAASAKALFNILGYESERTAPWTLETFLELGMGAAKPLTAKEQTVIRRLKSLHLIFQVGDGEISRNGDLFDSKHTIDAQRIESYLFLAADLPAGHYTRSDLTTFARLINKPLPMPAIVLFRHGQGEVSFISLAMVHRRLNQRDMSRDVLEKATIIKDISCHQPHRAHIDILGDLAFTSLVSMQPCRELITNFITLHRAWQKVLDVQTLNKTFFTEIRNWFYWARAHARFPDGAKKDADGRDSEAVIRLLTRMIFCWFLREKKMLPDELFAEHRVVSLLKNWSPKQCDGDKTGTYYKAVLQNLFFATLATPVAERKFRSVRTYKGLNKHYGDQRCFRHVALFIEKAPVEELYKTIPFLNGGLFENLDEFPGEDNDLTEEVRVDGFSDVASKQPLVPDFLFFGDERSVPEIADLLGESTAPKARGLLHIFRDYKFTVEENTPLEQDIALDPELLGRAFENLLAAVNPETGTVARKSTGSFYTPREIVHYMVEEALVRYLLGAMAPVGASDDFEKKVHCHPTGTAV